MRFVISSLAVAVALGVAWVAWPARVVPPAVTAAAGPAAPAGAATSWTHRIEALERRLGDLEGAGAAAPRTAVAVDPPADVTTLRDRIAALEAEVARLRTNSTPMEPLPDSIAGVKAALKDKNLFGSDVPPELLRRRMELRRRLLELAPDDPEAPAVLTGLKDDYVRAGNAEAGRRVLDEFGVRVAMPRWRLDLAYAHVDDFSGHRDRGRQIYSRVASNPTVPDSVRARAQFSLAYSFMQQASYDDARAQFRALIAEWGEDPPAALRNTVNGAKTQLEKIAEWEKRRAAKQQQRR